MAVKTKEQIIEQIKARLGEDNSDEAIAVIEDVSDTYDALTGADGGGKDWKSEAERIDKEWREKYIARFSGGSDDDDDLKPPSPNEKSYNYEDLFK